MMPAKQKRLEVMEKYIANEISRKEAASLLELSERQISRLKAGMLKYGQEFIMAKTRKSSVSRSISSDLRAYIVGLKTTEQYRNLSILQFQKTLEKECGIALSYSSLYQILDEYGCITDKRQRSASLLNGPRCSCAGQLLFIIEEPLTIHHHKSIFLVIDDCTRKILAVHMDCAGSIWGYFSVMDKVFRRNGLPMAISIPHPPANSSEQLLRIMDYLGVELLSSCPADRLPILEKESSAFLHTFYQLTGKAPKYDGECSETSTQEILSQAASAINTLHCLRPKERSAFLPIIKKNYPEHLLCLHYQITLNRSGGFSVNGIPFELEKQHNALLPSPHTAVRVFIYRDFRVLVYYQNQLLHAIPRRLKRA